MTTTRLPILFLNDLVVLPGMVVPVELDDATKAAIDAARAHSDDTLLVAPRLDDRYASYGVVASIVQLGRLQTGDPAAVLKADRRVKIGSGVSGPGTALWIEAEELDPVFETDEIRALAEEYKHLLVATLQRRDAWQVIDTVNKVTDPSALADLAGYASWLTDEQKRELLETPYVADRLRVLVDWVKSHIAETEVNDKISEDVREGMEKSQREFLLRQQLATPSARSWARTSPRGPTTTAPASRPPTCPTTSARPRCARSASSSGPATRAPNRGGSAPGWTPCSSCPGRSRPPTPPTSVAARRVLDADHHGLEDVKDRIVEYLAVRARRVPSAGSSSSAGVAPAPCWPWPDRPGWARPPWVRASPAPSDRKFVRVALGGVRDEAEIRGHRRTYVGALPGRIVRAITEAGSMNPVVLLDEVDKVGSDYRGDPSAALLEVLDPAQNHTFRDHYLEVDLDLSDVLFMATANVIENIPQPLLDRMELVQIDGYTEEDKVVIAREHPVPAAAGAGRADRRRGQRRRRGPAPDRDRVHPRGRRPPARAGCWARRCGRRPPAWPSFGEQPDQQGPLTITLANLRDYLGRPRFTPEAARADLGPRRRHRSGRDRSGVATCSSSRPASCRRRTARVPAA